MPFLLETRCACRGVAAFPTTHQVFLYIHLDSHLKESAKMILTFNIVDLSTGGLRDRIDEVVLYC